VTATEEPNPDNPVENGKLRRREIGSNVLIRNLR